MKRNPLITASMAVLALAAASCGSSAPKAVSETDFISSMNSICRTADRAIGKLDSTDRNYVSDIIDIVQTGFDDLSALKAPKALSTDFDDFTANLDDQLTQFAKLNKAIKNGDDTAAQTASDKLDKLSADSDDLADSIGADKCVGVGSGAGATVTTDTPPTDTTAPPSTDAPATTTPDTVTVNTPLPIDTTVDTTSVTPSSSSTSSGVVAGDASVEFQPITGYAWGTLEDVPGTLTPTDDPVLGPVLAGYYVGVLESTADGTPVYVYVTVLNQDTDWTQAQLDAYFAFELVADGSDITTPTLGLPGKAKVGVVDGYDGAVFTIKGFGVSLLAPTGTDVPTLLDAFAQAQSMGG